MIQTKQKEIRITKRCNMCSNYNNFDNCCELWDKQVKNTGECDCFKSKETRW